MYYYDERLLEFCSISWIETHGKHT